MSPIRPAPLLIALLALCFTGQPAHAATRDSKVQPISDHAVLHEAKGEQVTFAVQIPPAWSDPAELAGLQIYLKADPDRPITLTEYRVHAGTPESTDPEQASSDAVRYPLHVTGAAQRNARHPLPKHLAVTLRVKDRTHTVRCRVYPEENSHAAKHNPKPTALELSYRSDEDPERRPERLPLIAYTNLEGEGTEPSPDKLLTYFQWEVPLPATFSAPPGELVVVPSVGSIEGLTIDVVGTERRIARVIGRFRAASQNGDANFFAVDLRHKDHSLVQVVARLDDTTRVARGGPGVKEAWDRAKSGISGQSLTLEGPLVKTFRKGSEGYLWIQIPVAASLDSSAHSAVPKSSGAAVRLLTGTVESLLSRSVVHVVGRFREGGKAVIDTRVVRTLGGDEPPRALPPIEVTLPSADGGDPAASKAWLFHMRKTLERKRSLSPSTSFFAFADRSLARRFKTASREAADTAADDSESAPTPGDERPEPDLLSAGTGLLAVQEALQLDAMRGSDTESDETVDLKTLEAPQIASHPFEKMIGTRTPALFDMDRLAPEDHLWAHAATFERALALTDDVEAWGVDLAHLTEGRSTDHGVRARYTNALLVDSGPLARVFGDRVVADCGVILSDPFVREGCDVALVLNLKDRALADAALTPRRKLAELSGAKTAESTLSGTPVRSWTTADGTVSLHEADAGPFRILATSPRLLAAILEAHAGKTPALARAADYRYMRTLFPGDPREEDGFVYLSDAFVRRMVSPAFKLAARRRLLCAGQLTLLHNAHLMARIEGRPGDIPALRNAGDLPQTMACPDRGTHAFEGDVPTCSVHGRLGRLAPLAAERLTHARESEAEAYRQFVTNYNSYWRTFFDPVGVRARTGARRTFETIILPLVENSIYTSARELLPGPAETLKFHGVTPTSVLAVAAQVPREAVSHALHTAYADEITADELPDKWLGRTLAVVVHDAAPLFSLDFSRAGFLADMILQRFSVDRALGLFVLTSFDMPVVASVAVTDEAAAWRFVEKSFWRATRALRRTRGTFFDTAIDPYLVREGAPAPVLVVPLDLFLVKLRFYVSIHAGRIWVSNQLGALVSSMTAPEPQRSLKAAVAVSLTPARGLLSGAERQQALAERFRRTCLANLTPAWVLLRLLDVPPERLADEARATLGFVPVCPEGGRYELEAATDEAVCSRHGSPERARQQLKIDPAAPAARALARLTELLVSLEFTPEGLSTRLELDLAPATK